MINRHDHLAAIIFNSYYFADSIDDILSASTLPDSASIRDRIFDAIDSDIADMLHNSNLTDLLPFAADLELDDDDFDFLTNSLLDDNSFLTPLTDLILSHSDLLSS